MLTRLARSGNLLRCLTRLPATDTTPGPGSTIVSLAVPLRRLRLSFPNSKAFDGGLFAIRWAALLMTVAPAAFRAVT